MRTQQLRAHYPFIDKLSEPNTGALLAELQWVEAPPRTLLISKGDEVTGVYLVVQGGLRVHHLTPDGRESTLYWVEPGDCCVLALNCVFTQIAYPACVSTDGDAVRAAKVPANLYRQLFANEPAVQRFTFDTMSRRIFDLMTLMTETVGFGMEQRVAALLLRRANPLGQVSMSQATMANHLGSAREVVSRAIRALVTRGLVTTRRGTVDIVELAELRELANP